MARPTKYKAEFARLAEKYCRLGATDAELADLFEVDVRTLYRWKAEHEPFCQALKLGKDSCDNRVERSLFERATGYSHPDCHISNFQGAITVTPIVKHYPPDSTACIFWLKNRRPEQWREKQAGEGDEALSEVIGKLIDKLQG